MSSPCLGFLIACDCSMNPADIIPVGIAVKPVPKNVMNALSILPKVVIG